MSWLVLALLWLAGVAWVLAWVLAWLRSGRQADERFQRIVRQAEAQRETVER